MPGPETAPRPSPGARSPAPPVPDTASAVVGWAAFSCVLVPVILVWFGASLAGATGTALGLATVTGACRLLMRQSERGAARLRAAERDARPTGERSAPRGRHGRAASAIVAEPRGGGIPERPARPPGGVRPGVMPDPRGRSGTGTVADLRGWSGTGAHRGGRRGTGNKPVD
ncbi:hypothetical protein [Streptomyces siamensis]|uniref:Uncharacterized protein n=1 Tax=Streptomyces siamensis TaxID=1274986 RepID=A0ABP9IG56_9ACTN